MFASNTSQVSEDANYIESCFSTHLYTGNGSTQTITNGIDLAGEGGLVWAKGRSTASDSHRLYDTVRGLPFKLQTPTTAAQSSDTTVATVSSFNSDGFTIPPNAYLNDSGQTYASWTFRKQEKFFDCVTYTGTGSSGQAISHNLGSIPGCIIIKCTSDSGTDWIVHHRSVSGNYLTLNTTSAQAATGFGDPATASVFYPYFTRGSTGPVNSNGLTYVAYLFAHNAGGFGLSGEDNVISCGSFTTDGSGGVSVDLGYEPQWLTFKASSSTGPWFMTDSMRGFGVSTNAYLRANTSDAETTGSLLFASATGFYAPAGTYTAGVTYIYIAIRRGPMKVPESGTSVFSPQTWAGDNTTPRYITAGFPVDAEIIGRSSSSDSGNWSVFDRLRGVTKRIRTTTTAIEDTRTTQQPEWPQNGIAVAAVEHNATGNSYVNWMFRRAPGFFDEVCYTGDGNLFAQVTHGLTVTPQLIIGKSRSASGNWAVWSYGTGVYNQDITGLSLNSSNAALYLSAGASTFVTSTYFSPGFVNPHVGGNINNSGVTYVAYLFASVPGVSKVGSYTGTGTTQTINCGFTGGARFVLIKAASTTGDWLVADSARGIVSGNDPYLELNTTNAEVTGEDWLDTDSSGFVVNEVSGSNANTNGVTYIFLAIA